MMLWSHHSGRDSYLTLSAGLNSSCTVIVKVLDENNNPPVFSQHEVCVRLYMSSCEDNLFSEWFSKIGQICSCGLYICLPTVSVCIHVYMVIDFCILISIKFHYCVCIYEVLDESLHVYAQDWQMLIWFTDVSEIKTFQGNPQINLRLLGNGWYCRGLSCSELQMDNVLSANQIPLWEDRIFKNKFMAP